MTHSILQILITALISGLAMWANHYSPWRAWLGKKRSRAGASTAGTLAMLMPVGGLFIYWMEFPPAGNPFAWALAALMFNLLACGLTVLGLGWADKITLLQVEVSELEEWRFGDGTERLDEVLDKGRSYRGRDE